jgi:hypothetical protein
VSHYRAALPHVRSAASLVALLLLASTTVSAPGVGCEAKPDSAASTAVCQPESQQTTRAEAPRQTVFGVRTVRTAFILADLSAADYGDIEDMKR